MKKNKFIKTAAACIFAASLIFASCTGDVPENPTDNTENTEQTESTDSGSTDSGSGSEEGSDSTDTGSNDTTDEESSNDSSKEGYFKFESTIDGAAKGSVVFVLNYESSTLNKASKLTDVDIEYILNDGAAQHYTGSIAISKNQYGTDYQAKVSLLPEVKIKANDKLYLKITAKVDVEEAATIIQGNLIDTDASVDYWKELCAEDEQKQILTGITYEAPAEGADKILFEGSQEIDWSDEAKRVTLGAEAFEVMSVGDKIVFEIAPGPDGYCGVQANYGDWSGKFNEGTLDGANPDGDNLFNTEDGGTVKYTPTAAVVEGLKAKGCVLFGHGTITKIYIE